MSYFNFLKERILTFLIFFYLLFSFETFLLTIRGSEWLAIFIGVNLILAYFLITFLEFFRQKKQYDEIRQAADSMEEKYLASEILGKPGTEEGALYNEVLHDMGKAMSEKINHYKRDSQEYKEYIELWIHEVKIPIAAAQMIIENHKNEITKEIETQIRKIERYTEQVLYYARSNEVEKDYYIKNLTLEELVNEALVDSRKELILLDTSINLHDLQTEVKSDGKWIVFILGQLIGNSIKYVGDRPLCLEIYGEEEREKVKLHVKDNGIGVKETELQKVFDKGFTGSNGRNGKKSTGIGLYLCKKLCNRLGHGIELRSKEKEGCEVILTFPKSSFSNLTDL